MIKSEKLKNAITGEDTEKIKQALIDLGNTYEQLDTETDQTLAEQIISQQTYIEQVKTIYSEAGKDINEETQNSLTERLTIIANNLVESTNTVNGLTEENIEAWRKLAEGSAEVYNEKISNVNEDTRLVLEAILGKVDISSPEYIKKWTKMAQESGKKYTEMLSKLPPETQAKILASTMAVTGMTESTKLAFQNLSEEGRKAFDEAIEKLEPDTRNNVKNAITAIDEQKPEGIRVSEELGQGIQTEFDTETSKTEQSANNFITGFKKVLEQDNPLGIFGVVGNFARKLIATFNRGLDEHSPSKETEKSAKYFIEGFSNQINKLKPNSLKQIKELATGITNEFDCNLGISDITNGIKVNPNDFRIDTNQFIDYSKISGAIATQGNIKVDNDLDSRIENAIYRGLSNATIPVEIEATTDEGVIFKKVQVKAKEFYTQTGEPAFDF